MGQLTTIISSTDTFFNLIKWGGDMDIVKIALAAGMQVSGSDCAEYKDGGSVVGSLQALQRFADALHATVERESSGTRVRDTLVDCPAIRNLVESDPLMFV